MSNKRFGMTRLLLDMNVMIKTTRSLACQLNYVNNYYTLLSMNLLERLRGMQLFLFY